MSRGKVPREVWWRQWLRKIAVTSYDLEPDLASHYWPQVAYQQEAASLATDTLIVMGTL